MADDFDERIRSLENQFLKIEASARTSLMWGSMVGLAVIAWLGITTFYSIPKAANDALTSGGATAVTERLHALLTDSEQNAKRIAELSIAGKAISVDGQCFKPRTIFRCFKGGDHMTWVDNSDECSAAGYRVENSVVVLGSC